MSSKYRTEGVVGKRIPESASCDQDGCDWEYEGDRPHAEARLHSRETGHPTVVWGTYAHWYRAIPR